MLQGLGLRSKSSDRFQDAIQKLLFCLFIFFPNLGIMSLWLQKKHINVLSNAQETCRQLTVLRLIYTKAKCMIIQPEGKEADDPLPDTNMSGMK